jgi:hypothetical protein
MNLNSNSASHAAQWLRAHCQCRPCGREHDLTWFVGRSALYYYYLKAAHQAGVKILKKEALDEVGRLLFGLKVYRKPIDKWVGIRFFRDKIGSDLYFGT